MNKSGRKDWEGPLAKGVDLLKSEDRSKPWKEPAPVLSATSGAATHGVNHMKQSTVFKDRFQGHLGKPKISWMFNGLSRALRSASVPGGDRAALISSARAVKSR
jgi:hypothetical protein